MTIESTLGSALDEPGFTERLLEPDTVGVPVAVLRVVSGCALSSLFGFACALDHPGGPGLAGAFAMAAPPMLFAVAFVPALYVLLAISGRDPDIGRLVDAASRGVAVVGMLLVGLAPAAALFELSEGGRAGHELAVTLELLGASTAGAVGLAAFGVGMRESLREEERGGLSTALLFAFGLCAALLALRIWWPVLDDVAAASTGRLGGLS